MRLLEKKGDNASIGGFYSVTGGLSSGLVAPRHPRRCPRGGAGLVEAYTEKASFEYPGSLLKVKAQGKTSITLHPPARPSFLLLLPASSQIRVHIWFSASSVSKA